MRDQDLSPNQDSLPMRGPGLCGDRPVIVTPQFDDEGRETTISIRGLKEGAHVVISIPGVEEERFLLIGKKGKVHSFGFGNRSDQGPVRIGP